MHKMLKLFKAAVNPVVQQFKEELYQQLSAVLCDMQTVAGSPLIVYPAEEEGNAVVVSVGGSQGRHVVTDFKFSVSIDEDGTYQSNRYNNSTRKWECVGQTPHLKDAVMDMLIGIDGFNQIDRDWRFHQKPWADNDASPPISELDVA